MSFHVISQVMSSCNIMFALNDKRKWVYESRLLVWGLIEVFGCSILILKILKNPKY